MRLAVVGPFGLKNVETFIKAHIEYLSDDVYVFHGDNFFPDKLNGKPLFNNSIYNRVLRKIQHRLYKDKYEEVKLAKSFKKLGIDLVLAEYGPTGVAIQKVCEMTKTPFVVHFHGFDISNYNVLQTYSEPYKKMFLESNGIIGVSKDMCAKLRELGAPEDKLIYNPCGVDTSIFKPNDDISKKYNLLFVGRFVEKKSPILIILIIKKLVESGHNIKIAMVGDGHLLGAAKKLTKTYHLENNIIFKGRCSHREISKIMQNSQIYIQHSVVASNGDSEGTPVSILEAMSSGLPIVSTRHAGIKEAVDEGENGYLVEELDLDEMTLQISDLLDDEIKRESMGVNARKKIIESYAITNRMQFLKEKLENLC